MIEAPPVSRFSPVAEESGGNGVCKTEGEEIAGLILLPVRKSVVRLVDLCKFVEKLQDGVRWPVGFHRDIKEGRTPIRPGP